MSVSGQSSARPAGLFFVEPIPALGIVLAAEDQRPVLPQCVLGPASAGLFGTSLTPLRPWSVKFTSMVPRSESSWREQKTFSTDAVAE